ncbi:hypothetical protein QVG61_05195 [Thiohalobacter sp. IOR34]|uniref:hypothetical protein n=1 Tax=Thiohalobacter sp. IOR34 TaxID=3057176 RepID=UPI0025B016AD|nr:hypothetical protein [Thiohalobacter sp. IOR34]WJW76486.1 hypothetical protein QVG61_05195 [Thiohalobacter sp. IOR34]
MVQWDLRRIASRLLFIGLGIQFWASPVSAMPEFARKYSLSCAACHAAFPRLNKFGEHFRDSNMRLPNWKDNTVKTGDERLALPPYPPLAVRAQAYVQARDGRSIDPLTGVSENASTDFQSPYLIKLLSSAPLSDHISYYFYGILAEKGGNGQVIVEDAWFRHDDIFGSGVGMMLGQFQVSDLMFARETRLSFQDFMAYRMAGITYDRGVLFDRGLGPIDLALGLVNGNGIEDNLNINSPGYRRPDKMFDNDNSKTLFGRIGGELGPVRLGLFGLSGKQRNATGAAGLDSGSRNTDKRAYGLDLSGVIAGKAYWFGQYLWNEWDGFLSQGRNYQWQGGFLGLDYIANDRWAFSALYNYADAGDLANTDTIYEGIDINSLSLTASYYFMRNVKGVAEANIDFLDEQSRTGSYYTGHLSKENYILFGFDAAF